MKFWIFSLKNLKRNKKRNLALFISVIFSFCGFVLFQGYVHRAEGFLKGHSVYVNYGAHLSIYKKNGFDKALTKFEEYSIKKEELIFLNESLKKYPEVEHVFSFIQYPILLSNGCSSLPVLVNGIEKDAEMYIHESEYVKKWNQETYPLLKGKRFFEYKNIYPIYLTPEFAEKIQKKGIFEDFKDKEKIDFQVPLCDDIEKRKTFFNQDANIQAVAFTPERLFSALDLDIVGWRRPSLSWNKETESWMLLEHLQELLQTENATRVGVYLHEKEDSAKFLAKIKKDLNLLDYDIYTEFNEKSNPFYVGNVNILRAMTVFFLLLLSLAILFSTINTVLITIMERTFEIGCLRTLGYRPPQIASLFLREIWALTLISCFVGSLLCLLMDKIITLLSLRLVAPGLYGDVSFMLVLSPFHFLWPMLLFPLMTGLTSYFLVLRYGKRNLVELLTSTRT